MQNYFELKAIKYKNKYLSLRGGMPDTSGLTNPNDILTVYSFNILNPSPQVTNHLFANIYLDECHKENSKKIIDRIAKIDEKRFNIFRKNTILDIIDQWYTNDSQSIICLQEVNDEIKDELVTRYGDKIRYTTGDTVEIAQCVSGDKKNKRYKKVTMEKREYRVTIIGDNLSFIKDDQIVMKNKDAQKNGLYTKIQNNKNGCIIDIFNIHTHYKSTPTDIEIHCKNMMDLISRDKYIICGDFNTKFSDDGFVIFKENLENTNDISTRYFRYKDFTSYDTKSKIGEINKEVIDHIIIGNNVIKFGEPEILYKINNDKGTFYVFYDLEQIIRMIDLDKSDDEILDDWLRINKNSNISDHIPIKWKLRC